MSFHAYGSPGAYTPPKLFRMGEQVLSSSFVFPEGKPVVGSIGVFPFGEGSAFDVSHVDWEIMTRTDRDLEDLLFFGSLKWDFLSTIVPIAPLSYFGGGVVELFNPNSPLPKGNSDLEKIANVKYENEMTLNLNDFRLGNGRLYRGRMRYLQYPISIPGNTCYRIVMETSEELVFLEPVRVKVNLHAHYKNVVELTTF